ncbi:hypothetical protein V6N13_142534 [Hibiscus sabdariffa]
MSEENDFDKDARTRATLDLDDGQIVDGWWERRDSPTRYVSDNDEFKEKGFSSNGSGDDKRLGFMLVEVAANTGFLSKVEEDENPKPIFEGEIYLM